MRRLWDMAQETLNAPLPVVPCPASPKGLLLAAALGVGAAVPAAVLAYRAWDRGANQQLSAAQEAITETMQTHVEGRLDAYLTENGVPRRIIDDVLAFVSDVFRDGVQIGSHFGSELPKPVDQGAPLIA